MYIVNHYIKSLNCYPSCDVIMAITRGMKSLRRVADTCKAKHGQNFSLINLAENDLLVIRILNQKVKMNNFFVGKLGIGRNLLRIIPSAWLL